MTNDEVQELARELNTAGRPYALVTVVRVIAPTSAYLGGQAIVLPDGTLHGWIGGGCAKSVVINSAQSAIESGEPQLVRIRNDQVYLILFKKLQSFIPTQCSEYVIVPTES